MRPYNVALFEDTNLLPWYHGRLSTSRAERLLNPKTDGLFLVRDSLSVQEDFVLMLCHNQEIFQYRIVMQDDGFTLDKMMLHDTLEDLVNYHRNIINESFLKTKLTGYVVKEGETDLVPWNHIKIVKIRRGTFGGIILGVCSGKRIMLSILKNPEGAKSITNRCICHENLLNVVGLTYFNHVHYLVTYYPKYGNLLDLLTLSNPTKIPLEKKQSFAFDISCGMEYLEKMVIQHKILSAINVLITNSGIAKLTHYGLSEELPESFTSHYVRWKAPETILNNVYSNKTDVWSYGVCLWEIFTDGKTPYENIAQSDIYASLEAGVRLEYPAHCPQDFIDIMELCWKWNPDDRPTFYYIKKVLNNRKQQQLGITSFVNSCVAMN